MDPSNQPPGAWNSFEKLGMQQPTPPPAFQEIPAGYPPSYPSQPVSQGFYVQGPYPGPPVVAVQPAVFVTAAPLANPEPDTIPSLPCCSAAYLWALLHCFFPGL
ncbi:hypothetical protein ABG768_009172 [Culter alburnus]|uniref:Deleted in azoospermia-associated protein 2 n=1 Tax=Culter alburnus TaxID=194366 RepID=A0AAW1ZIT8_CULAL